MSWLGIVIIPSDIAGTAGLFHPSLSTVGWPFAVPVAPVPPFDYFTAEINIIQIWILIQLTGRTRYSSIHPKSRACIKKISKRLNGLGRPPCPGNLHPSGIPRNRRVQVIPLFWSGWARQHLRPEPVQRDGRCGGGGPGLLQKRSSAEGRIPETGLGKIEFQVTILLAPPPPDRGYGEPGSVWYP